MNARLGRADRLEAPYERRLKDGSKEIYSLSNGATTLSGLG